MTLLHRNAPCSTAQSMVGTQAQHPPAPWRVASLAMPRLLVHQRTLGQRHSCNAVWNNVSIDLHLMFCTWMKIWSARCVCNALCTCPQEPYVLRKLDATEKMYQDLQVGTDTNSSGAASLWHVSKTSLGTHVSYTPLMLPAPSSSHRSAWQTPASPPIPVSFKK